MQVLKAVRHLKSLSLRDMPPSLLRLLLGVGLLLGERADVIDQVPVLFRLNTLTFGRHVFVAVVMM